MQQKVIWAPWPSRVVEVNEVILVHLRVVWSCVPPAGIWGEEMKCCATLPLLCMLEYLQVRPAGSTVMWATMKSVTAPANSARFLGKGKRHLCTALFWVYSESFGLFFFYVWGTSPTLKIALGADSVTLWHIPYPLSSRVNRCVSCISANRRHWVSATALVCYIDWSMKTITQE